jgi:hypothetical protein
LFAACVKFETPPLPISVPMRTTTYDPQDADSPKPPLGAVLVLGRSSFLLPAGLPRCSVEFSVTATPFLPLPLMRLVAISAYEALSIFTPLFALLLIVFV